MRRVIIRVLAGVLFIFCLAGGFFRSTVALADIGPEFFDPIYMPSEGKTAVQWMENKYTRARAAMLMYAEYINAASDPVEIDLSKPVYTARDGDIIQISFFTKNANEFLIIIYKERTKEAGWKLYTSVEDDYFEVRVNNIMAMCDNGSFMNYPNELLKAQAEISQLAAGKTPVLEPAQKQEESADSVTDRTIFDSDGVIMTLDSIKVEFNPVLDSYTLYFTVYAENNGDEPITIMFDTITLNGYETRCTWGFKIGIDKKAREKVTLFNINESTGVVNADDIETVEFCCYTANSETNHTITKNLGVGNVIRLK